MNKKFSTMLLFGPPGSGKGTIGRKLAVVTEQYHLSSGDVFRGLSPQSELGKLQKSYSDKGELVPDQITVDICLNYIKGLILTNRFYPERQTLFLDGFPRTMQQAKLLAEKVDVKKIFLLEITNERVLFERLKKRAFEEGRIDDMNEATLRKRMEVYKTQTEEVLSFYDPSSIVKIKAEQSPTQVFKDVLTYIADVF